MPDTIEAKTRNAQSKPSFAAFVSDESIATVNKAAEELGLTQPRVARGTVADATRRLADVSTPKQLVVDISGSADPLADMASLAEVCDEGTKVIALGDVNDVELYRSLIAAGVHDYLVKPVSAEALMAALTRAERGPHGEPAPKMGRLIAVVGTRGYGRDQSRLDAGPRTQHAGRSRRPRSVLRHLRSRPRPGTGPGLSRGAGEPGAHRPPVHRARDG